MKEGGTGEWKSGMRAATDLMGTLWFVTLYEQYFPFRIACRLLEYHLFV